MWKWSPIKSFLLGLLSISILYFAGIGLFGAVIIGLPFTIFASWVIGEINFIRNSHGSNLEEIETKLDEFKSKK
ncbi:MAG: hypothetical protein PHX34_05660 [Candidatus Shapirobacteria bacterium]|nr:hypothetical protein [Candidatus Shapirobacteria bacterium]